MYNIPSIYRAEAGLNPEKLANTIQAAIEHHPLTNICIDNIDGTPVINQTNRPCCVDVIRLSESEINHYVENFVRPFDLQKDPLYRAAVLSTESHIYFILDFHHMIFDGTSLSVLIRDIGLLYEGKNPVCEELTQFNLAVAEEKNEETDAYKQVMKYLHMAWVEEPLLQSWDI